MNELDKYGALVEPTIGLPYSTSGGYGPGSVKDAPAEVKKVASSMSMSELDKFGKLVGDIKKKRRK